MTISVKKITTKKVTTISTWAYVLRMFKNEGAAKKGERVYMRLIKKTKGDIWMAEFCFLCLSYFVPTAIRCFFCVCVKTLQRFRCSKVSKFEHMNTTNRHFGYKCLVSRPQMLTQGVVLGCRVRIWGSGWRETTSRGGTHWKNSKLKISKHPPHTKNIWFTKCCGNTISLTRCLGFGIVLDMDFDYFGIMFWYLLDYFGGRVGTICGWLLRQVLDRVWRILGTILDHVWIMFGTMFGLFWGPFWTMLGGFWGSFLEGFKSSFRMFWEVFWRMLFSVFLIFFIGFVDWIFQYPIVLYACYLPPCFYSSPLPF